MIVFALWMGALGTAIYYAGISLSWLYAMTGTFGGPSIARCVSLIADRLGRRSGRSDHPLDSRQQDVRRSHRCCR